MSETKQGVRNLNGPTLNGRGHNGRRSANCLCKRDPQRVAKITEATIAIDRDTGVPRTVYIEKCAACSDVLGDADTHG